MPDAGSLTINLDAQTAEQLSARAREEGITPEHCAASWSLASPEPGEPWPPPSISDYELRRLR